MEEAALIKDAGMEGGEETLASLLPMPLLPAPSIDKPAGTNWQESLCRTGRQACAKALWLKEQAESKKFTGAVPKRARASVARRRKEGCQSQTTACRSRPASALPGTVLNDTVIQQVEFVRSHPSPCFTLPRGPRLGDK